MYSKKLSAKCKIANVKIYTVANVKIMARLHIYNCKAINNWCCDNFHIFNIFSHLTLLYFLHFAEIFFTRVTGFVLLIILIFNVFLS